MDRNGKFGYWLALAAASGFVSVAAGAFGAHGLEGRVGAAELAAFETGARYQMYHALALIAVAWMATRTTMSGPHGRTRSSVGRCVRHDFYGIDINLQSDPFG